MGHLGVWISNLPGKKLVETNAQFFLPSSFSLCVHVITKAKWVHFWTGGQAKTLMFVHISPDMESFGETISTLKFAERVSSVELGAACSNKVSGEVQNLRDQVPISCY
jgi:hypothetical protein